MQIRDDLDTLPELAPKRRRETDPMQRLLNRNQTQAEDETIRIPLSALAFWHDPMNPDLETLQVCLNIPSDREDEESVLVRVNRPENPEEEEELVGPLVSS